MHCGGSEQLQEVGFDVIEEYGDPLGNRFDEAFSWLDFVQKPAEALRSVLPAQAGTQWRVVSNPETLPGSGLRRSGAGNPLDSAANSTRFCLWARSAIGSFCMSPREGDIQ